MPAYLHGLATALPPHELPQDIVRDRAEEILGPKYVQFARMLGSFASAGIDRRYSVAPLDWFERDHAWKDRNDLYLAGATKLFAEAATRGLEEAGWGAAEVDCIVTISSTGIATPTLEAQVHGQMGFRDDVIRVPVFGLGCAGGVSGLTTAEALAVARPGAKVLLVAVETCTLSFRTDRLQKADIIATVLFGDGAAAACLSTEAPRKREVRLGRGLQYTWPDTLAIMGWDVDDTGLGVIFDRSIPEFVTEEFAGAAGRAVASSGGVEIDRFVCHPGGAKVVTAIEGALHLPQGSLDAEREVLRTCGNMSAPTVLFVLDQVLRSGASGRMMTCALGPGFTGSFMPMDVAA